MQYTSHELRCLGCGSIANIGEKGHRWLVHNYGCSNRNLVHKRTPCHPNQRLEAARREIAERSLLINDEINRVIYYDDVFYTCSICGRSSTNVGLILNHDCN